MAAAQNDDDLNLGIEKEQGSKKKLIIIALVGVLLLGGGLAVAWFLIAGGDSNPDDPEQAQKAEAEASKLPALYLPLDPVFVVNLPPGSGPKLLQVGIQVMVRQPELIDFLKHNDPMIRHHLLDLLGSQEAARINTREGKEKLQAEVNKRLNKIIQDQQGPGEVEGIYFTSFVMQ